MSKAHIPPAVAIRGHTTFREKKQKQKTLADYFLQFNLSYLTRFKIPMFCISCEIFDENFHIQYIGVRGGKGKIEKEGKSNFQHLGFVFSNSLGHPKYVYKM